MNRKQSTALFILWMDEIEMDGKTLRKLVNDHFRIFKMTGPGFYQMMSRLENEGLVTGREVPTKACGVEIKQRLYKITEQGTSALYQALPKCLRPTDISADDAIADGPL